MPLEIHGISMEDETKYNTPIFIFNLSPNPVKEKKNKKISK